MTLGEGLLAFVRAIVVGAFVAAFLGAAVVLVGGIISTGFASDLIPLVLTGFFAAAGVTLSLGLVGATFIGLPTTAILRRFNAETAVNYVLSGAVSGFLLMLASLVSVASDPDAYWLAGVGAVIGGLMGQIWWRSFRQHVAGNDGYRSSTSRP